MIKSIAKRTQTSLLNGFDGFLSQFCKEFRRKSLHFICFQPKSLILLTQAIVGLFGDKGFVYFTDYLRPVFVIKF